MEALKDIVAIDLETTGLDPCQGDRVCEIAFLKISGGRVIDRLSGLVNPSVTIPQQVSLINQITDTIIQESDAPRFNKKMAEEIASFIRGHVLLVHNADFDIRFLKAEFQRCGVEFPESDLIDTLYLARRYFNFPNNSLYALAERYCLDTSNMHRAEKDAMLTYQILCKFIEEPGKDLLWKEIYRNTRYIFLLQSGEIPEVMKEAVDSEGMLDIEYMDSRQEVVKRRIKLTGPPLKDRNNRYYVKAFCCDDNVEKKIRFDKIVRLGHNVGGI